MKKIKTIVPKSLARVSGFLYGLLGLIGGLIVFVISLFSLATGHGFAWFGLIAIILFPLGYGIMGLIFGYVGAWIYNFVAKKVGGIEIEVE